MAAATEEVLRDLDKEELDEVDRVAAQIEAEARKEKEDEAERSLLAMQADPQGEVRKEGPRRTRTPPPTKAAAKARQAAASSGAPDSGPFRVKEEGL